VAAPGAGALDVGSFRMRLDAFRTHGVGALTRRLDRPLAVLLAVGDKLCRAAMPTVELDDPIAPLAPPRPAPRPLTNIVGLVLVFALFPLGVAYLTLWLVATLLLHAAVLALWFPRGRRVLFVYSDSPRWKTYLDEHVVPYLPKTAVVLNWSERARWSRRSLGVWVFCVWRGERDFNPLAIVVRAWPTPRVFRFGSAFDELERGRREPLRAVEAAFWSTLAALGATVPPRAT
jgi:hypothetical protein